MKPCSPVIPGKSLPEIVYAKNQKPYIPLPTVKQSGREGMVTTRWHLTWRERIETLLFGNVYLQMLTFNEPLQPIRMSVYAPDIDDDLVGDNPETFKSEGNA